MFPCNSSSRDSSASHRSASTSSQVHYRTWNILSAINIVDVIDSNLSLSLLHSSTPCRLAPQLANCRLSFTCFNSRTKSCTKLILMGSVPHLIHRQVTVWVCCTVSMEWTPHWSLRALSDTVSCTFTYHTWQFTIFTIFTFAACIWTQDLALQQILSSIDLFLAYQTDSTYSRTI